VFIALYGCSNSSTESASSGTNEPNKANANVRVTLTEQRDSWSDKFIYWSAENPYEFAFTVQNKGTKSVDFKLRYNDGIFYNDGELIAALSRVKSGEGLHQKAFYYLRDHRRWSNQYTQNSWYMNPLINLNSMGLNLCGVDAKVLSNIWYSMGYDARTNFYPHHGVPEVFTEGKWQMYDITYGVFYKNNDGSVAFTGDLRAAPSLVTNPIDPMAVFDFSNEEITVNAYQPRNATVFTTEVHRGRAPEFNSPEPVFSLAERLKFTLPPGAQFTFPVKELDNLMSDTGYRMDISASGKMLIPDGYEGVVDAPFFIQTIKGAGHISLHDVIYDLSDQADQESLAIFINSREHFNHRIETQKDVRGLEVVYAVNPKLFYPAQFNVIDLMGLDGQHVTDLQGELIPLPKTEQIKHGFLTVFASEAWSIDGFHWNENGAVIALPTGGTTKDSYIVQFKGNLPDRTVSIQPSQTTRLTE